MAGSTTIQWILVVDDDADFRAVVRQALELRGHRVLEAGDGREAIELMKRHEIPVLITDIYMPRMDGIELLRFLKDRERRPKIIAVTGETHRGALTSARAAQLLGAENVLLKPFDQQQLLRLLDDRPAAPDSGVAPTP